MTAPTQFVLAVICAGQHAGGMSGHKRSGDTALPAPAGGTYKVPRGASAWPVQ